MLLFKYKFKNFISFIEILPLDTLLGISDALVKKTTKTWWNFPCSDGRYTEKI